MTDTEGKEMHEYAGLKRRESNDVQMFTLHGYRDEPRSGSFVVSIVVQVIVVLLLLFVGLRPAAFKAPGIRNRELIATYSPPPPPVLRLPPLPRVPPMKVIIPVAVAPSLPVPAAPRIEVKASPPPLPVVKTTPPTVAVPVVKLNVFTAVTPPTTASSQLPKVVQVGGFGAVDADTHSQRRSVQLVAFGGASDVPVGSKAGTRGGVSLGGFGQEVTETPGTARHSALAVPRTSPVQVEGKTLPIYTDEARRLHIEGEVLVEVIFQSDGEVRVVGIAKGLGHGLDESAIQAVKKIRFKPAQRDEQNVESDATLHVVFALS
jgi:TonB family protein